MIRIESLIFVHKDLIRGPRILYFKRDPRNDGSFDFSDCERIFRYRITIGNDFNLLAEGNMPLELFFFELFDPKYSNQFSKSFESNQNHKNLMIRIMNQESY